MGYGCGGELQFREALGLERAATVGSACARAPLDAPLGRVGVRSVVAFFGAGAIQKLPIACKNSGLAGVFGLRSSSVRKKVIGHRMRDGAAGVASGKQVGLSRGTLAFLQKETRASCVRVVVHPLIKQGRNLLADIRPRLNEWVADFALAGQKALDGPDWASRMVLFRLYYLGLAPYENARHFLGLSERSWVIWTKEIRQRCGEELLRRGLFPPRKYFREVPRPFRRA